MSNSVESSGPLYSRSAFIVGAALGIAVNVLAIILWPDWVPPDNSSIEKTLDVFISRPKTPHKQASDHLPAVKQADPSQSNNRQKNANQFTQADIKATQNNENAAQDTPSADVSPEQKDGKTWLRGYLRGQQPLPENVYNNGQSHASQSQTSQSHTLSVPSQFGYSAAENAGAIAQGSTYSMGQTYHRVADKCFVERTMWGQDGQESVLYPVSCGNGADMGSRFKTAVKGKLGP